MILIQGRIRVTEVHLEMWFDHDPTFITSIQVPSKRLLLWSALAFTQLTWAYTPPLGIPAPPFGIGESHERYADEVGYLGGANGPYTHYVDNRDPGCRDDGPATESEPLCSLPTMIDAGGVVEVHGGPYVLSNDLRVTLNGTAAQPVFYRGITGEGGAPAIQMDRDSLHLAGRYYIFEGFLLNGARLNNGCIQGSSQCGETSEYGVVRHNEVRHQAQSNGTGNAGHYMVSYKNHIHHNQGDDRHGIFVSSGSENVWLLENLIHHNGGDGIQFCHGCDANPPENIYIGGNTIFSDRENGLDFKYAKNVVVSQNRIFGYVTASANTPWCFDDVDTYPYYGSSDHAFEGCYDGDSLPTSGSDGSAVVVGSDGAPVNVWLIFNTIHSANNAIRVEEAGLRDEQLPAETDPAELMRLKGTWIIGNRLYNVGFGAITLDKRAEPLMILHNTIHGADKGINQHWRVNFQLEIENNIISDVSEALNIESGEVAAAAILNANLLWHSNGEDLQIEWNQHTTISSSADINMLSGTLKLGNIMDDPQFANSDQGLFDIWPTSPVRSAGNQALETADNFYKLYFGDSQSLMFDLVGRARAPTSLSIGALEVGLVPNDNVFSSGFE